MKLFQHPHETADKIANQIPPKDDPEWDMEEIFPLHITLAEIHDTLTALMELEVDDES